MEGNSGFILTLYLWNAPLRCYTGCTVRDKSSLLSLTVSRQHPVLSACDIVLQERRLLQEGIKKFPGFHKLYLMLGQLEERQGNTEAARRAYLDGLKRCMDSVPLWRSIAQLEEAAGSVAKARALLEQVTLDPVLTTSCKLPQYPFPEYVTSNH